MVARQVKRGPKEEVSHIAEYHCAQCLNQTYCNRRFRRRTHPAANIPKEL
jgi:hypothetical protein